MYPTYFKTFLKLLDVEAAAQTDATVKQHEDQERKKKQQAMEEAEAPRFAKKMQKTSSKFGKTVELRPFNSVAAFCNEYKREISVRSFI